MSQDGTFTVPVSPRHPSNGHPSWCDPTHCTISRLGPESNPEPGFESSPQGVHQSAPTIIPADPPVETVVELHLASLTTMRGITPQTLLILDLDIDLGQASDLDLDHAPDVDLGLVDLDHSDMGPGVGSELGPGIPDLALRSGYAPDPGSDPKTYPMTLCQARTLHEARGKLLASADVSPRSKGRRSFGAANRA